MPNPLMDEAAKKPKGFVKALWKNLKNPNNLPGAEPFKKARKITTGTRGRINKVLDRVKK